MGILITVNIYWVFARCHTLYLFALSHFIFTVILQLLFLLLLCRLKNKNKNEAMKSNFIKVNQLISGVRIRIQVQPFPNHVFLCILLLFDNSSFLTLLQIRTNWASQMFFFSLNQQKIFSHSLTHPNGFSLNFSVHPDLENTKYPAQFLLYTNKHRQFHILIHFSSTSGKHFNLSSIISETSII